MSSRGRFFLSFCLIHIRSLFELFFVLLLQWYVRVCTRMLVQGYIPVHMCAHVLLYLWITRTYCRILILLQTIEASIANNTIKPLVNACETVELFSYFANRIL